MYATQCHSHHTKELSHMNRWLLHKIEDISEKAEAWFQFVQPENPLLSIVLWFFSIDTLQAGEYTGRVHDHVTFIHGLCWDFWYCGSYCTAWSGNWRGFHIVTSFTSIQTQSKVQLVALLTVLLECHYPISDMLIRIASIKFWLHTPELPSIVLLVVFILGKYSWFSEQYKEHLKWCGSEFVIKLPSCILIATALQKVQWHLCNKNATLISRCIISKILPYMF